MCFDEMNLQNCVRFYYFGGVSRLGDVVQGKYLCSLIREDDALRRDYLNDKYKYVQGVDIGDITFFMGLPAYINSVLLWLRCPPLVVLIASTTNLTGQIFGVSSKESDAGLHEPLACATSAARLQKTKSKKMMRLYALSFRSGVNMTMKRTTGRRACTPKDFALLQGGLEREKATIV